jgi:hypothetical protein
MLEGDGIQEATGIWNPADDDQEEKPANSKQNGAFPQQPESSSSTLPNAETTDQSSSGKQVPESSKVLAESSATGAIEVPLQQQELESPADPISVDKSPTGPDEALHNSAAAHTNDEDALGNGPQQAPLLATLTPDTVLPRSGDASQGEAESKHHARTPFQPVPDNSRTLQANTSQPELPGQNHDAKEAPSTEQSSGVCAVHGLTDREVGRRPLVAILVAHSASDIAILPMAVRELRDFATSIVIVTPSYSIANNMSSPFGFDQTYNQLNAITSGWEHLVVDTSDITLEAAIEMLQIDPTSIRDNLAEEAVLGHARWRALWDGAAQASALQDVSSGTLLLLARSNEIPSVLALRLSVACELALPIYMTLTTHRFGFGFQDGEWNRPEILSAQVLDSKEVTLSAMRMARADGHEDRAFGAYPVRFAGNLVPNEGSIPAGSTLSEAGWHTTLFGGAAIVRVSIVENLTPSALVQISEEQLEAALEVAMNAGHDVLHEAELNTSTVQTLESIPFSLLPQLVNEAEDDMNWALHV